MTNHNNASEIQRWDDYYDESGYVGMCKDDEGGWVAYEDHAETIQRLVSERDDYKEAYDDTKRLARLIDVALCGEDGAAKQASLCDLVSVAKITRDRAEAAERERDEAWKARHAWFAATGEANRRTYDANARAEAAEKRIAELEAERAHSEAAKGVNTQYAWALFHLGLSDDDDPEEFGRQLSDKIDGMEADLQQAREALEPFADYFDTIEGLQDYNAIYDIDGDVICEVKGFRRAREARDALERKKP